ncbi:MAG: lysylphosphatidylglycerol synthase domain-containing protein [Actinomycetes bacterium]
MGQRTETTTSARGAVVVEPVLPDRVRRPTDLLRFVLVLAGLVLVLVLGNVAVGTAAGLEQDLVGAVTGLPRLLLVAVTLVGGVGVIAVPVAVAIDLLVRRRPTRLLGALVAATLALSVALGLETWVMHEHPGRLLEALTKVLADGRRSSPVQGLLTAVVAFLITADLAGRRRIQVLATIFLGSVAVTGVLSGSITVLATGVSILLGWTVGLLVRYVYGAASTRPPGREVADALVGCGLPVVRLERVDAGDGEARSYRATMRDDAGPLDVHVLDRDTFGSNIAYRAWRRLRLRGPATRRSYLTVRSALDHEALMSLAVARAGVPAPELVAVCEVGRFAALTAYRRVSGVRLDDAPVEALDTPRLEAAFLALARMQSHHLVHRGLTGDHVLLAEDGRVVLLDLASGDVAVGELAARLDTVQLLVTLALRVGVERAVKAGAVVLGPEALLGALPLLQRIALARSTRQTLREHRRLLHDLRAEILTAVPSDEPYEEIKLERLPPRTLLAVVGGAVAAYVVLTQLARVNIGTLVAQADWRWGLVALGLSAVTYLAAAMVVVGFVVASVSFLRAVATQLAVSFVSLVAPSAVGNVALNARFLERSGVDPAVAVGSVGLSQTVMFVVHAGLLVLFGVLAGTGAHAAFVPPQGAVIGVLIVVILALIGLSLPVGRRLLAVRVAPLLRRVIPRLVAVFQQPRRLAVGVSGGLILNIAYILCLDASVRAFGAHLPLDAVAVVYLAGAVVGSAIPTPGGLGGIEAAMSYGLAAAGRGAPVAVSAVLLYRVVTFWLPIPVGWLSFTVLHRRGQL